MSWLTQLRPKLRSLVSKKDIPDHLWTKCPQCEQMVFHKDLIEQNHVCRHCNYHFRLPVPRRLQMIFDNEEYKTLSTPRVPVDPLRFRDQKRYGDRLKDARQSTHCDDAVVVATGKLEGMPLVVSCFNFNFIGGSMGMAVGESLLMGAQTAVKLGAPYMVISASGGARMQEGIFSLLQMARSIIAVLETKEKRLPFLSLMTNPTTGGVAASFAALGDIILAEPNAVIGFTGARVIQETLRQPLPPNFQTPEFQKEHGFVDIIVQRSDLRRTLASILSLLAHKPASHLSLPR